MSTSTMAKKHNETDVDIRNSNLQSDIDIHNGKKNETEVDIRNSNLQTECRHPQW